MVVPRQLSWPAVPERCSGHVMSVRGRNSSRAYAGWIFLKQGKLEFCPNDLHYPQRSLESSLTQLDECCFWVRCDN